MTTTEGVRTAIPQPGRSHVSLTREVAEVVRDLIVSGRLEPGEALRERVLGDQLGVSRVPLREALIQLSHEGFVTVVPRRGAFVTEPTDLDIAELFDLRETLEGMAARFAAERRTDADLDAMRRAIEREHGPGGDAAVEADANFHDALIEAAHHGRLTALMAPMRGHIRRVFYLTSRRLDVTMPHEHGLILTAIEDRDPAAAGEAAERHVRAVRDATLEYLRATRA